MNIDERLKELVAAAESHVECGTLCTSLCRDANEELEKAAPALAQALLRARQALVELSVGLTPDVSQRCATKALADTELEEAL